MTVLDMCRSERASVAVFPVRDGRPCIQNVTDADAVFLAGVVVLPNDSRFTNDSTQWNSRFVASPAGIVYVNSTADVSAALKFAQLYARPLLVLQLVGCVTP